MNSRKNISRLLTVAACVAALAGCGSDEEGAQLPADASQALRAQLQSIQNRIDDGSVGACQDILAGESTNLDTVNRILDQLPEDVDQDVRDATRDSFNRLFELVEQECNELEDETDTETTPAETETETVPTETVPTATETETTPTETLPLEPPADNGNGNGKDKDKGNNGSQGGGQAAPDE